MKARDLCNGHPLRIRVKAVLIVILLSIAAAACEDRSESAQQVKPGEEQAPGEGQGEGGEDKTLHEAGDPPFRIVHDEGPMPGPDTVLAAGEGIEVTLRDFEVAIRRSLLFAPVDEEGRRYTEVPPETMAMPHLHITATQNLVAQKVIVAEARKRGMEITPEEVGSYFTTHGTLSRFAPLFTETTKQEELEAELEAMGLTSEDLRAIAHDEIFKVKLEDKLIDDVGDEELWQAYQLSQNTVDLLVIAAPNTPSSRELDEFIATDAARSEPHIDRHFRQHPERYVSPDRVRLTMLRAPAGQGGPELEEKLKQAVRRLSSGEDVQAAASGLGLELEEGALLLKTENPRAFASKVGEIGYATAGPRGAYTWRVEEHIPSEPLELTRPLRREIAAELLRQGGILPSVTERLEQGLEHLRALPLGPEGSITPEALASLEKALKNSRMTLVHTGYFPRAANGYIPKLGLAEEVAALAFSLDLDGPMTETPILSRGRAHVLRLVGRNVPTRADFQRDRESFLEAYREQTRPSIVYDLLMKRQAELGIEYDVRPLRVKYGVLAKD